MPKTGMDQIGIAYVDARTAVAQSKRLVSDAGAVARHAHLSARLGQKTAEQSRHVIAEAWRLLARFNREGSTVGLLAKNDEVEAE